MYCHICIRLPIVLSEIDILYILPSFGMYSFLLSKNYIFFTERFQVSVNGRKVNRDQKKLRQLGKILTRIHFPKAVIEGEPVSIS